MAAEQTLAPQASGLRGSLRVSPQTFNLLPPKHSETGKKPQNEAPTEAEAQTSQPSYMASVALLFPVEAATLFPMAQGLAGRSDLHFGAHGNAYALFTLMLLIVLFIGLLRYFATQDEQNRPAPLEIFIAMISFLLWAGASGGYWLDRGGFVSPVSVQAGSAFFAFLTIMWVALVPYAVRESPNAGPRSRHRTLWQRLLRRAHSKA